MKKIVMAYRENDLFNKYIPKLIEIFDVVVKIFPRETTKEEIASWRNQNIDDSVTYISDHTCGITRGRGVLDVLFRVTTEMAILGGVQRRDSNLENSGIAFRAIIKMVAEKNIPKKIAISVSSYLCSHQPFDSFSSPGDVAKEIARWLVDAGIPENKIQFGYLKQEDDLKENWVIYDRHDFVPDRNNSPKKALSMCIPIETLYEQCLEAGLIEASTDEFLQQLIENFKKVLDDDDDFLWKF